MKCSDCPMRMVPFFFCSRFKQPIDDGKTELIGCNLNGELPPILSSNEAKDAG